MIEPVRRHSIWVWVAVILIGWLLVLSAPKQNYQPYWMKIGQPADVAGK